MHWRHLRPGELDHEKVWLLVSLLAAGAAWAWVRFALPVPACTFRAMTGCACPTCGATRAVTQLFHGNLAGALYFNPLVTCAAFGAMAFNLYAAFVLAARLPRLRGDRLTPRSARFLRVGACAAALLNWVWLVRAGI